MPPAAAKKQDKSTRLIYQRLRERFPGLPQEMDKVVYRYNPASIRVRVVDAVFAEKTYTQREAILEDLLQKLPVNVRSDITLLLLLTPVEADDPSDYMNLEFGQPTGSYL
ncbi:MAG: hypothetical protein U0793_23855 [Gemmataceae bacterium]|mgnify:CR=1 FL=1